MCQRGSSEQEWDFKKQLEVLIGRQLKCPEIRWKRLTIKVGEDRSFIIMLASEGGRSDLELWDSGFFFLQLL